MNKNIPTADNWDIHWQEMSKDFYFNTPAIKYRWKGIKRLLDLDHSNLSSVKLMDFGCGTGNLLKYFLDIYKVIEVKGTDNSHLGIEIAQKILPKAEFFQADLCASQLDGLANYYSWATHGTCSEVLEHLDDPVEFLKNTGKFLRKGAILIISVPGGPMSSFDHHVGHRKHYSAKLLTAELTQAGYKVEKIICAGFPFHNLYRLAFILRGKAIFNDARRHVDNSNYFYTFVMNCFHFLFNFNLFNSGLGWTILAKATWNPL